MNTVLGSLLHRLFCANPTHIIWCIVLLAVMIVLAVLHHIWKEDAAKIRLWRLLCLIPLLACIVHALIFVWGFPGFLSGFFPLYVIGLFALLPIPFAKRKIGYRITAVITGLIAGVCSIYLSAMSPDYFNHTRESYTASFHSMVEDMDRVYILKEWKEVDLDALEAKYLPMVQEAEQAQDPARFADAVTLFCNELHDGHVFVQTDYDESQYTSALKPREYGLAMVQLDDGRVIAVCTERSVNQLGIEDGTVITKWDGTDITEAVAQADPEAVLNTRLPVRANADRIAAIALSGVGGETVEVSFLDKSGKEQTVTLTAEGENHTQMEALRAFLNFPRLGYEDEFQTLADENFSTRMLDDKCGCLRLTMEGTDNGVYDMFVGYMTGNHTKAREMFREKLRELKAQGMEYLVIDLRNNMGGMDEIGAALCDLLTTDSYYAQGLGIRQNGQYKCVSDHGVRGDGEFADLQVVALTNFGCLSAGDGTSLYLSKLPNVTLAGITDPCGCNQETGGCSVLSGGLVFVQYPVGLILDGNGDPNIDTRADRISRNPVEERIPLDYDAAMQIFRDHTDYELNWAMAYLTEHAE